MKSRPFVEKLNTITMLVYLIIVILITVLSVHPFVSAVSALAAGTAVFVFCSSAYARTLFHFCLPMAIFVFVFNFLFNHNGVTVLFYIIDSAITKEALIYSVFSVLSFVASLFWFSVFSELIGSDRIYDLFSGISKNLAVIFALAMSMIPNILAQSADITAARDNSKKQHRITTYMLRFTALFSNVLESSFETAVSMKARGALLPKSKQKRKLNIHILDVTVILLSLVSLFFYFYYRIHQYSIYPYFQFKISSVGEIITYALLSLFIFLPHIIIALEDIKWKCIQSKI